MTGKKNNPDTGKDTVRSSTDAKNKTKPTDRPESRSKSDREANGKSFERRPPSQRSRNTTSRRRGPRDTRPGDSKPLDDNGDINGNVIESEASAKDAKESSYKSSQSSQSKTAQKESESARSDAEQFKKPAEISPDHKKEVFESEAVGKKSEGTQLENNHNELPSKNTEPSLSDTSQATPVISPESFEKKEEYAASKESATNIQNNPNASDNEAESAPAKQRAANDPREIARRKKEADGRTE
jgi:hypothetical protein